MYVKLFHHYVCLVGCSFTWNVVPLFLPVILKSHLRSHLLSEAFSDCPRQHLFALFLEFLQAFC